MVTSNTPLQVGDPSASQPASIIAFVEGLQAFAMALVPIMNRVGYALLPVALAVQEFARRPDVEAKVAAGAEMMLQAHSRIAAVEAPGYTPYFERLGYDKMSARLHALMIRFCADRCYREYQDRGVSLAALHDLARRPRWHPALARQVVRLRETCWNADFIKEACRDAGCPEREFMDLLHDAGRGDYAGGPKLIAIAKRITPYAPSPRGRPMAFDTVFHQTFLRWSAKFGGRQAYTYGPVPTGIDAVDDFIDEATAATRIELKRPSFIPVAARRAERRRVAREPMDETVVDRL